MLWLFEVSPGQVRCGRYGQLWSFGVGFVWVRQVRCVTDWLGRVTSRSGESRRGRHGALSLILFWYKFGMFCCGELHQGLVG